MQQEARSGAHHPAVLLAAVHFIACSQFMSGSVHDHQLTVRSSLPGAEVRPQDRRLGAGLYSVRAVRAQARFRCCQHGLHHCQDHQVRTFVYSTCLTQHDMGQVWPEQENLALLVPSISSVACRGQCLMCGLHDAAASMRPFLCTTAAI